MNKETSDHFWWMFMFHSWRVIAVYNRDEPMVDKLDGDLIEDGDCKPVTRPRTDILYRCPCGKVKTKTVQGKWTLEQVKGG